MAQSGTAVQLAVNGTLMRGLELEKNLQNAGARFVREAITRNCYRLWSIRDIHPARSRRASPLEKSHWKTGRPSWG